MNFFPSRFIARHQTKLLFIVVWLHVTTLDFFYVTFSGPTFFWQESMQFQTLAIHLSVALITSGFYFLLRKFIRHSRHSEQELPLKHSSVLKNTTPQRQIT